jgi:LacI family transcriptional regulator
MRSWIAEGDLPEAIFAVNDPTAIGAMIALSEAGIRIPKDVAISGAGAIHYGPLLRAPLTTVDWDLAEMGQLASRLLIEAMEGNKTKNSKTRSLIVKPRLVARVSCGAGSINRGAMDMSDS